MRRLFLALLIPVLLGASGDAIYVKRSAQVTLSGGQFGQLTACMATTFPVLISSQAALIVLQRDNGSVFARACDSYAPTDAELLALELAGDLGGRLQDGTYLRCVHGLDVVAITCWINVVNLITPELTMSQLQEYVISEPTPSTHVATGIYLSTDNPAQYVSDREDGLVVRLVGQVP